MQGKRAFVKDMAFQLSPWRKGKKPQIATSLQHLLSEEDAENPSVLPLAILRRFQWIFLLRHPQRSIPSLYRLSSTAARREETGWLYFLPSEAGYFELRQLFDYLLRQGVITSGHSQKASGEQHQHICLIDAEDLLQQPENTVKACCQYIGLDYRSDMLRWDSKEDDDQAAQTLNNWAAFHADAIKSRGLNTKRNVVGTRHFFLPTIYKICIDANYSPIDPKRRISIFG